MAVLAVLIFLLCLLPLASGQCETITSPLREFCPFYNYTSLDETNQVQAATFVEHFKPLFSTNCSTLSKLFICASYSPFCQPPNHHLLPCRELCFNVYSSCIHVFSASHLPWPSRLNCSRLPSPPELCLSPIVPPPHSVSTSAPSSTTVQPSRETRFSVYPSSYSTTATARTTATTAIVTTTSPSSSSSHLILGLSLSLVILVMIFPLCLFYACRHLCPRHPPPTSSQDSTVFGPTLAPLPLPLPPQLPTQLTRPPSSPPTLLECPPPPLPPRKSNVEYQNIHVYSVIAN